MIAALARTAVTFDHPDWLNRAVNAYRFVSDSMSRAGRLGHAYRDGKMTWPGFATDYAAMATAALALSDATGQRQYLDDAITFADLLETWHLSDDGTYRLAASDAEDVIIRMRSGVDETTPNPNGTAANLLIRLYHRTGETRFIERADRLLSAFASDAAQNPVGHASLLSALSLRTQGTQIVIIGDPDDSGDESPHIRSKLRSGSESNSCRAIARGRTARASSRYRQNQNRRTCHRVCLPRRDLLPANHGSRARTEIRSLTATAIGLNARCSDQTKPDHISGFLAL